MPSNAALKGGRFNASVMVDVSAIAVNTYKREQAMRVRLAMNQVYDGRIKEPLWVEPD